MGVSGGSDSWEGWCVWVLLLGGGEAGEEMGEMPPERRRWMEVVIALKWPRREDEVKERLGGEFCWGLESADSRRAITDLKWKESLRSMRQDGQYKTVYTFGG